LKIKRLLVIASEAAEANGLCNGTFEVCICFNNVAIRTSLGTASAVSFPRRMPILPMKKSLLTAVCFVLTLVPTASRAAVYLNEDFSTYADGALVGQNGWTQYSAATTNPIQISGGKLVMAGNTVDNQDAQKALTFTHSAGTTLYFGFQMEVTGPGVNGAGFTSSYFTGLFDGSFVNTRVGFLNIDGSTYQVSARINGQGSNPFTSASDVLSFNTDPVTIILGFTYGDGGSVADTLNLWVNPTSLSDPADLSLTNAGTAISSNVTALVLSQYSFSSDTTINKLAVADTFSETFSVVAVPEPGIMSLLAIGAGVGLTVWRRRRAQA